ncbi:CBS domain-containing protein [Catellatospora methionotrophica]|uniref:CBS domain-containing protein n=1 Tax=Catellatospora methionotrophica TaxID=121620 RepID=UPI0033C92391
MIRTDVATATEDTPVMEIIRFLAVEEVDAVLILDLRGRVTGVVTPDDPLPGVAATRTRAPHRYGAGRAAATQAWHLLRTTAPVVSTLAPLSAAAELMRAEGARHIVAVDDGGRILGVVSREDLVRSPALAPPRSRHDSADRRVPPGPPGATSVARKS